MPAQHRRSEGIEVALPDHRYGNGVLAGQFSQRIQGFMLGRRYRERVEPAGQAVAQRVQDAGRNGLFGQLVKAGDADRGEHGVDIGGGRTDVAVGERHGAPGGRVARHSTRQRLPSLCHQPITGA